MKPDSSLKDKLLYNIKSYRIPITASIMITNKCNFTCKHCYLNPEKCSSSDLKLDIWFNILLTLKKEGTIFLVITGGEPLASDNFLELYQFAYNQGFKIIIFTNLSLFNDKHLEIFKKMPPEKISITLYGDTDETYKNFCGVENVSKGIKDNIKILNDNHFNIHLKTVANVINYKELKDMKLFSESISRKLSIYRTISCDINDGITPVNYQLSKEDIKKTFVKLGDFSKVFKGFRKSKDWWDNGYKKCDVGISFCYINSNGEMYLCNKYYKERYSILTNSFKDSWEKIYELRKKIVEKINICTNCKNKYYCGKCTPHILSLPDKYSSCIQIKEMADELGIPEKCYTQYISTRKYRMTKISDCDILIPINNKKCILLNHIGKIILSKVLEGYTISEVEEHLLNLFNVNQVKVENDIKNFLEEMLDYNVIKRIL